MDRIEWLEWRKQGIGSSDVPAIMGVSPWKTKLQLWAEKTSTEPVVETSSYITDKGNRFEPKIRSLYEFQCGYEFPVALVTMEKFPFMRASLDGRSTDRVINIEIKLVGKDDHELAKAGKVPEKYIPQVQHQLLVSGAKWCEYLSYHDNDNGNVIPENLAVVTVLPDPIYQAKLLEECVKFWDLVQTKKPPQVEDRDYKSLRGMTKHANKYRRLKQKMVALKIELDEVEDLLVNAAKDSKHPRVRVGDIKLMEISRVGNVDYKKVPELQGVDLDKYRGKGSLYWRIDL